MGRKLGRESVVGGIGLGDDKNSGRVLVDSMDDSGASFSADAGQVASEMMQERVDQRAGRCPGGRVDDHSCGLVDDGNVSVFVDYLERNVLGPHMRVSGVLDRDLVDFSVGGAAIWVTDRGSVPGDVAIDQEPRQPGARQMRLLWHIAGKRLIKARRRIMTDGDKDFAGHGRRAGSGH